jgi:hypothetical protein
MTNYIFLMFLPGAAGNFFSRCLNLASDNCFCWINPADPKNVNLDINEKFNLLQYSNSKKYKNWIEFEKSLTCYYELYGHTNMPNNSFLIWLNHPNYNFLKKNIAGPDDQQFVFYIDSSKEFEWMIMNSLYKNNLVSTKWFVEGQKMLDDDEIYKIKLTDIITSEDTLINAVSTVCNVTGVLLHDKNKQKIKELWNQWIATTLCKQEFDNYKKYLGWKL